MMKVKTFTGTDPSAVDQQVNDWLATNGVKVLKTSTAFQRLRDKGQDAITGKTITRRAVGIAVSVWYEEPAATPRRPDTWIFRSIQ
jgi:Na+-translocating ferredoxin:NAD+ oxidoreductase RnfG subunit